MDRRGFLATCGAVAVSAATPAIPAKGAPVVRGALEFGRDLSDSLDIGQIVVQRYGQAFLKEMDTVIVDSLAEAAGVVRGGDQIFFKMHQRRS